MDADLTHGRALTHAKATLAGHASSLTSAAEVAASLWDVEEALRETAQRCVADANEMVAWRKAQDARIEELYGAHEVRVGLRA